MKFEKPVLQGQELLNEIKKQTYSANERAEIFLARAKAFQKDAEKDKRLKQSLCAVCFYLRGTIVAGAALTESNCQICGNATYFGSTHTDRLCLGCAEQHKLCKQCLSTINLKDKRKI